MPKGASSASMPGMYSVWAGFAMSSDGVLTRYPSNTAVISRLSAGTQPLSNCSGYLVMCSTLHHSCVAFCPSSMLIGGAAARTLSTTFVRDEHGSMPIAGLAYDGPALIATCIFTTAFDWFY